jgi:hypothetical protein
MNNQYIYKFKQAIEHNLKIAKWEPTNNQILSIANDIYERNYEPDNRELLYIIKGHYSKEILYFANEGLDNSDLITLLALATQVKSNADK